jgi:hypothetical protein
MSPRIIGLRIRAVPGAVAQHQGLRPATSENDTAVCKTDLIPREIGPPSRGGALKRTKPTDSAPKVGNKLATDLEIAVCRRSIPITWKWPNNHVRCPVDPPSSTRADLHKPKLPPGSPKKRLPDRGVGKPVQLKGFRRTVLLGWVPDPQFSPIR